jgi:hypothetical protein
MIIRLLLAHQRLNVILSNKLPDRIGSYNAKAPEVFLQAKWGRAADIWTRRCLVCFRIRLFLLTIA